MQQFKVKEHSLTNLFLIFPLVLYFFRFWIDERLSRIGTVMNPESKKVVIHLTTKLLCIFQPKQFSKL